MSWRSSHLESSDDSWEDIEDSENPTPNTVRFMGKNASANENNNNTIEELGYFIHEKSINDDSHETSPIESKQSRPDDQLSFCDDQILPTYSSTIIEHRSPDRQETSAHDSIKTNPLIDGTRVMKDVPAPEHYRLCVSDILDSDGAIDIDCLREHFYKEGRLTCEAAIIVLEKGALILSHEENLIHLNTPIIVAGDIHGQFYDLLKIFEIGGSIPEKKYLFLGDYVDRGSFAIECLLYLVSLKITYPDKIYLLRGNHESAETTQYYSFKKECLVKYSFAVYEAALDVFNRLPLAAVIDGKYLCLHGGLSPELYSLADINKIDRFRDVPISGPFCDLLWSDPSKRYGFESEDENFFTPNTNRKCSYYFTYAACCHFLRRNKLVCLVRAHEVVRNGCMLYKHWVEGFPSLITLFSCPNYCDVYGNKGAIIIFTRKTFHIRQFIASPHPYCLPDFNNAISLSLPVVAESVTAIFQALLQKCRDDEESEDEEESKLKKREEMKRKIGAVGKVARFFKVMREENSKCLALQGLSPTRTQAEPILAQLSTPELEKPLSFDEARALDELNEQMQRVFLNEKPDERTPAKSSNKVKERLVFGTMDLSDIERKQ